MAKEYSAVTLRTVKLLSGVSFMYYIAKLPSRQYSIDLCHRSIAHVAGAGF